MIDSRFLKNKTFQMTFFVKTFKNPKFQLIFESYENISFLVEIMAKIKLIKI